MSWSNTPGVKADDYDRWKTHFGETVGNGSVAVGLLLTLSEAWHSGL